MKFRLACCLPIACCLLPNSGFTGTGTALIGWQTFANGTPGNNNSGIADDTPDTNSTFDATPVGSHSGGLYLTGAIGANASITGLKGLGQATNNNFLNGDRFGGGVAGNGELIVNWTLADGSPGTRIGPFNNPAPNGEVNGGTSSWKFANNAALTNGNQVKGDFSITNHSDYYFRLEFIHFDARALGNATGSNQLDLVYLAGSGELLKLSTGTEIVDLKNFHTATWTAVEVQHISQSVGAVVEAQAYIPPGQSAAFRFLWSGETGAGQSQIDNLAFEGTFFETAALTTVIDPATVTGSAGIAVSEVARSGNSVTATVTSASNVDVYKSTALPAFNPTPVASDLAPGSNVTLDSTASESEAFYRLVPTGTPAP